jgi:hypothetical protein
VKRIRIAAGLMLSMALLTISIGVQAASNDEPGPIAFLPSSACEELVEVLTAYDIQDHGGDAVINLEMIGPLHPFQPMSAWLPLDPPTVSFFRCDRPDPGAVSSDIATAP